MKKFTYKNKKTGEVFNTDSKIESKDFVLVTQIRNGMINKSKVNQKNDR